MIYILIFLAKLLEVAITTVRVVLTSRGNRLISSMLAAVEISIWIVVASTVLLGITEDPLRAVAYCIAYVVGIYIGIVVEDKLALGLAQIEIIAQYESAKHITNMLRENGYGATTFDCDGMEGHKLSIILKIRRKDIPKTVDFLKNLDVQFVTITDIKKVPIGSINKRIIHDYTV